MKEKVLFLVCISLLFLQKSFSQNADSVNGPFSLKQCVDLALKNNADVFSSEVRMESSKVNVALAKGNMIPFISGNINHGLSQGRAIDPFTNSYVNQNLTYANYNLNATLYLWNGGSIQNNICASNLSYEASKMDWQQQKDDITISVILAYLQVLNNGEQLNAAKQQAEVTRKQVERLEYLNSQGAIAPATYYDTKGQLATDELNVVTLKNALETSKVSLAQLMNIPYSADIEVQAIDTESELVLYDATSQQIYQQAMANLAMVKAAEFRKQSASRAVKSAKGQLLPTLSLGGGLATNYSNAATISTLIDTKNVPTDNYVVLNSDKFPVYAPQSTYSSQKIAYGDQWKNNFNSGVSIGLQIPLFNGLQARSRVRQAKIDEKRYVFEAKTTKTQLQQAVEQAYVNMNTAYERYNTLTGQVQDFAESFRAAEVRFNEGVITSVDYLIAKNNYDRSNINLIAAKYDYILRTKILDFYQGRLSF